MPPLHVCMSWPCLYDSCLFCQLHDTNGKYFSQQSDHVFPATLLGDLAASLQLPLSVRLHPPKAVGSGCPKMSLTEAFHRVLREAGRDEATLTWVLNGQQQRCD